MGFRKKDEQFLSKNLFFSLRLEVFSGQRNTRRMADIGDMSTVASANLVFLKEICDLSP